jgi:hypothetical protein
LCNRKKLNNSSHKMACKYLWVGIILLLSIGVISGYSGTCISADEIDLGPKLTFFNGFKQEVDISSDVSCQEELTVKLTLTNDKDYWIRWDNLRYTLKVTRDGDDKKYDIQGTLEGKESIPPNEELDKWISIESYNELEDEYRLGYWNIQPEIKLEGVSCFSSTDPTKDIYCRSYESPSFQGNAKRITVEKEEITTRHTYDDLLKWLTTGINGLITLGAAAGAILTIWKLASKFGKRKR